MSVETKDVWNLLKASYDEGILDNVVKIFGSALESGRIGAGELFEMLDGIGHYQRLLNIVDRILGSMLPAITPVLLSLIPLVAVVVKYILTPLKSLIVPLLGRVVGEVIKVGKASSLW